MMLLRVQAGRLRLIVLSALCLCFIGTHVAGQQNAPAVAFDIRTHTLPKAYINSRFTYQLQAERGTPPYHWILASGSLPRGVGLLPDGSLEGVPAETGEFHFSVGAADSSRPPRGDTQDLVLKVSAPLLARWDQYPKITGQRIAGSVKVTNDTDRDFDLTFIVLAVNDIGRAQALGYQHFSLRKNTTDFEIPFGENVPRGSYKIYADVVAEVAATNTIHRARLETKEKLAMQTGP